MLLVELIKHYAGRHKTDKAILNYLNTEDVIAKFDPDIHVENITDEWLVNFGNFAGEKHVRNVSKAIKSLQ